jgi:hypothetical protein
MRLAGELMSEPRMPPDPPDSVPTGADLMARLAAGGRLERWAGSRLSHGPAVDGRAFLFADGGSIACAPELAAALAGATAIDRDFIDLFPVQLDLADVLTWLVAQGTFGFPDD